VAEIICRAIVSSACQNEIPEENVFPQFEGMSTDATFDGNSIVCQPCRVTLEPLLTGFDDPVAELKKATRIWQDNAQFLRNHEFPEHVLEQAELQLSQAGEGTPTYRVAQLAVQLAQAEIDRRAAEVTAEDEEEEA
jgi:hypothetical protein